MTQRLGAPNQNSSQVYRNQRAMVSISTGCLLTLIHRGHSLVRTHQYVMIACAAAGAENRDMAMKIGREAERYGGSIKDDPMTPRTPPRHYGIIRKLAITYTA